MIGQTIAHYRVTAKLGAGGMGEVYRATDSKLGREVALKVLPAAFAADAQRMQRFQREAQVLASLNHPHIAAIYGLEEAGAASNAPTRALVMELVEGPTLAERITQGAMPLDEALPIAKQIAEALEYAHERGIVHRDLKPANIKLTSDGQVKVLDFGLAKAMTDDTAPQDISNSPTLSMAATKAGMILGTVAYMSPEQAKGKRVDKRADIWAFGVVLFEMLTGRQAFAGETATDILAAVVRAEPDWEALPASVPRRVRKLLQRCLAKDDKRRLRDMGDARLELEDAPEATDPVAPAPVATGRARLLPWAVAVAAIVVAGWALVGGTGSDTAGRGVMHLDINMPEGTEPISGLGGRFAISPDGRIIFMIGVQEGVRRFFMRRLDSPEVKEVGNTEGANTAEFSPDSSSVVLVLGDGKLTRFSLIDQQRTVLASGADFESTMVWDASMIIFGRGGALWSVRPEGGEEKQLTVLDEGRHEVLHGDPVLLPGGRNLLFSSFTSEQGMEQIEALNLENGKRSVVVGRATTPVWSPPGHLLFSRDGAVWAVECDPASATVRGNAIRVIASGVVGTSRSGSAAMRLSASGSLLYMPANFDIKRVISVSRDGSAVPLNLPPGRYGTPRVSPDGRRLMVEKDGNAIEMLDLVRGTSAKLMPNALGTNFSTWTADGRGVVFRRNNVPFWAAADGSGKEAVLPGGKTIDFPSAAGPDSDSVVAVRIQPETAGDVFLLSISGKFPPKQLIATPAYDGGPQLSPDGRWMIYQSNESGQPQIFVRPYPALDRQWQISEGSGIQARWSRSGREIYYRNGQRMMAAAFDGSGSVPVLGKPVGLFADEYAFGVGISIANYDVTPDGKFIMLRHGAHASSYHILVNWTEELKKIIAAGGVR